MEDDDMKKSSRRGQRGKGKNQRNRAGEAAQGAKGILGAGISAVAGGFLGDAMGDMMDFGGGEDVAADTVRDNVCLMCMFFSRQNQNCNVRVTSMPVFLFHISFVRKQDLVDAADAAEAAQDAGEGEVPNQVPQRIDQTREDDCRRRD